MKRLFIIGLTLGLFFFAGVVQAETISGNTSAGENQHGWMFNRDTSTQTPYEFTLDQASAGSGSLYVPAISTNPSDKFIAEDFLSTPIADITSISYDFRLNGVANPAQFYMSVYANFGESPSTKFYDCRYSVVPSTGSAEAFTTVVFDPSQTYPVTQSGTSPQTCPGIPDEMNTGSTTGAFIRVIALNVGDTSASDAGVSGYLDNVVVTTTAGTTVSDFEPGSIITNTENESYLSLQAAVDGTNDGGTISLSGNITTTALVLINKALTINGNNHTLFAPINNSANSNSNNAGIGIVGANGSVVINNLIVDGSGSTKIHGINIFESSDVSLNGVTVKNNTKSGITINGSNVTANNVTTMDNAWGGINADQAADAPDPTVLVINGTSSHTESGPDVWRDDNSKAVTVTDTNNQYVSAPYTHDSTIVGTVFTLKTVVTPSQPVVVIINPTAPVSVVVEEGTNASLNFDSLITGGTGTLPETNIDSAMADVAIPAATVVTSADVNWNGVISAPTVVNAPSITADAGQTATALSAIEVGAGDTPLTFSKAVKLTFSGMAGKLIGWSQAGGFHAITNECSANDQTTMDTELSDGSDCKINAGADLVVWTKHFTTFVTYTQAPTPVSSGGSSTGTRQDISNLLASNGTPNIGAGQVLGAFTSADNQAEIARVKTQLITLITQLISLLQQQVTEMKAQGSN
jgi:hypothetical protein